MRFYKFVEGTRLYIGGIMANASAEMVESDFSGQSWTEIKGLQLMGSDEPPLTKIRCKIVKIDPGQKACIAAKSSVGCFAFRLAFPNGAERLYAATIMDARRIGKKTGNGQCLQITTTTDSNYVKAART